MVSLYMITNKLNGKVYIGQTHRDPAIRFKEHTHTDSKIGRSIQLHGIENFRMEVIDTAENQLEADYKERKYIKKYNSIENGYNVEAGGVLDYGEETRGLTPIQFNIIGNKIQFI